MMIRTVLHAAALQEFRLQLRRFCNEHLAAELRHKVRLNLELQKADYVGWQKLLRQHGWMAGHWPVAYGGRGWTALQRYVFEEETAVASAPRVIPFGVAFAAPVIYTFGTDEQKQRFLPGILSSDTWWCQGYSEPGAGSDLANLTTKADARGDYYVVNGQKTWTTMAHWADMMFALVRTSSAGKPRDGISFLLIDMKSVGVTIRPIMGIDMRHELNDVFFEDVRVPRANLVGREGAGWTYSRFLLGNERALSAEVGKAKRRLNFLRELLAQTLEGGRPLRDDPHWRRRLCELSVQLLCLESVCLDLLEPVSPTANRDVDVSMIKILGSELGQALTSALLSVEARTGAAVAGVARDYLYERASSIYSGTNEIQRNIIANSVLGL
jgi:alkylation response protein AidB-like acyl-CoA dehydrogenase